MDSPSSIHFIEKGESPKTSLLARFELTWSDFFANATMEMECEENK